MKDHIQYKSAPRSDATREDIELASAVAMAFVGSVVPDESAFHNPAFSRAGQMSQCGLLYGLERAGMSPSLIISARPMPSFPSVRQLWVTKNRVCLSNTLSIDLVGFLNLTPVKQMMIGAGAVAELLRWGWKTRHKQHRIIYTFNLSVPPGLCTLLAARLIGAQAFVSLNDVNVPGQTVPLSLANRLDFWLHKWLIPRFDGHITVTDQIMADFAPGKRYIRIEGGIRPEILHQTDGDLRQKEEDNFVIVAAGSLDEANGILVVIEAFSLIEGERYRLRIAGSGPLEREVREAAARDHRIEYVGYVSFEQVLQLYNSADVLINMRLTKTINTAYFYPSKIMEYLASGTPVISTCTGHTEEEFGRFCYLLNDETPRGLADLIQHVSLLDTNEREHMGREARAYMAANKTWDAQARKVAGYMMEMIRARTDSSRAPFDHQIPLRG